MPKRAWFQLRLSTAVLLMFAAGGLYYANLTPYLLESNQGTTLYNGVSYSNHYQIYAFGWPFVACRKFVYGVPQIPEGYYPDYRHLYIDIAAAIAILFAVAFAAEWLARRKSK